MSRLLKTYSKKMLVDTGFDGEIAIHYDDADRFENKLQDYLKIEYANGEEIDEIYGFGRIFWFGEFREVEFIFSYDEEPAIGAHLLSGCVMMMDCIENTLSIEKPVE